MTYRELIRWAKDNDVEKRANDGLAIAFERFKQLYPDEFDIVFDGFVSSKLSVYFDNIKLCVDKWLDVHSAVVVIQGSLRYDCRYVGSYEVIFDLNGKVIDDVLEIDFNE